MFVSAETSFPFLDDHQDALLHCALEHVGRTQPTLFIEKYVLIVILDMVMSALRSSSKSSSIKSFKRLISRRMWELIEVKDATSVRVTVLRVRLHRCPDLIVRIATL